MMGAIIIAIFGVVSMSVVGFYLLYLVVKDKVEIKKIDRILNRKEDE